MRISDWSSDVCSSDLEITGQIDGIQQATHEAVSAIQSIGGTIRQIDEIAATIASAVDEQGAATQEIARNVQEARSEEHTSELPSLMRISYAVFCLKKRKCRSSNTLDVQETTETSIS